MTLADFMLPQVSEEPIKLGQLESIKPPSPLFAGFDPEHEELLIKGAITSGVGSLTAENLATGYKSHRNIQFIESIPSPPKKTLVWDMEDGRAFDSQVYVGSDLNVFQYNRRVGSRSAVLWRLPGYFEPSYALGHTGKVEDTLRFENKQPIVFWRGAISGSRWIDPFTRTGPRGVRDPADFIESAKYYSRLDAALMSRDATFCDLKLTGDDSVLESKPWLEDMGVFSAAVHPSQQLENKYILCLNGNDVASNLYWVISTQSVAFKEDCAYEVVPDYFLKPWVHYVPIAAGLTDLREKFDYCQNNPDLCRRIIDNANQAYDQIINTSTWEGAEIDVLERLKLI